jgi:hypothetical protein
MTKSDKYDYRGYPTSPRSVNKSTWLYEEKKGLTVVRQLRNPQGVLVQSDFFHIPWRFILAAAKTPAAAKRRLAQRKAKK